MNKLSYCNSWMYDQYYVDETYIKDLKKISINGIIYDVVGRKTKVEFVEQSCISCAESTHYFIMKDNMEIDLKTLINKNMPDIIALEYTKENIIITNKPDEGIKLKKIYQEIYGKE